MLSWKYSGATIKQGDVYRFDFGPQSGNLQEGVRFLIVVQSDLLNSIAGYGNVIIVPTTTKYRNTPTFVRIEPNSSIGFELPTFAICNQIQTISRERLVDSRGSISKEELYKVKEALKIALSIS